MSGVCLAYAGDLSEPSGGTDRVSALAAGLAARGIDVAVVAPRPSGSLPDRLANVEFVPVPVRTRGLVDQPVRAVAVCLRARRVARRRGAHLQFEHATLAGVGSLLGCAGYTLDMHDLAHESPLYGDLPAGTLVQRVVRRVEGRALRRAARIVVVSERMADLVAATWNVPRERLTVVENGYFEERIAPFRAIETVPGRVVFLGTLLPKVDTDALLDITRLPAVEEVVVIGDGERRRALERAAHGNPKLRVTGRLPDDEAFSLLASATVAVNPQHASGLQAASSPVKLYYYATLGLPMVLTEGPDAARWLAEAGAADLVAPGDEFASAVERLLAEDARRERMANAATEAGRDSTWDRRVEQLVAAYRPTSTSEVVA